MEKLTKKYVFLPYNDQKIYIYIYFISKKEY